MSATGFGNSTAEIAHGNRALLHDLGIPTVSVCGSPGSGKTSLLHATVEQLNADFRIGVIVSNLAAMRDAQWLQSLATFVADVETADLSARAVGEILDTAPLKDLDLLLIESVGGGTTGVIDLGQDIRVGVFSVSGGDDKAAEFPYRVIGADLLLLTKTDLLPYVPFDRTVFTADVRKLNPTAPLLEVSVQQRHGLNEWLGWLRSTAQSRRHSRRKGPANPEAYLG